VDKRIFIGKASCGHRNARLLRNLFHPAPLRDGRKSQFGFRARPFIEALGFCSNKLVRIAVLQGGKRVFKGFSDLL
jgi:hypothetical protein